MTGKVIRKQKNIFYIGILMRTPMLFNNIVYNFVRCVLVGVKSGEISLWRFDGKEEVLIHAGENLNRMRQSCMQKNIIATGGLENKLKLFDVEKQKSIFNEKNLPHDWLELRVPIWISDLNFLPGTQQIATVGRYGHVNNFFVKLISSYLQSKKYTLMWE